MGKPQVFLSYSRDDTDWKDRVLAPLKALESNGHFMIWDDSQLDAGDDWEKKIKRAINRSDAAVLLVTNAFLNSKFITENEVPEILQRKRKGLRVFPLIVKPCVWEAITWLKGLQVRPDEARPLVTASEWDAEQDLADFAREVLQKTEVIDIDAAPPPPVTRKRGKRSGSKRRRNRDRIGVVSLDSGLRSLTPWLAAITDVQSMFFFERRSMSPPTRSIGPVKGEDQLKVYRLHDDFHHAMVSKGDKVVIGLTPHTLAFVEHRDIYYGYLGAPSTVDPRIGFLSTSNLEGQAKAAKVEPRTAFAYSIASHLAWMVGDVDYHEPLRRCPMDFTEYHGDVKFGLQRGRFCDECERALARKQGGKLLPSLQAILTYGRS